MLQSWRNMTIFCLISPYACTFRMSLPSLRSSEHIHKFIVRFRGGNVNVFMKKWVQFRLYFIAYKIIKCKILKDLNHLQTNTPVFPPNWQKKKKKNCKIWFKFYVYLFSFLTFIGFQKQSIYLLAFSKFDSLLFIRTL